MNLWKQINNKRWERFDNAVVAYDERANTIYAKPWSPHHRGWLAYSPADEYPISYETKKGFKVSKKYKTAASAINVIERLFPFTTTSTPPVGPVSSPGSAAYENTPR